MTLPLAVRDCVCQTNVYRRLNRACQARGSALECRGKADRPGPAFSGGSQSRGLCNVGVGVAGPRGVREMGPRRGGPWTTVTQRAGH